MPHISLIFAVCCSSETLTFISLSNLLETKLTLTFLLQENFQNTDSVFVIYSSEWRRWKKIKTRFFFYIPKIPKIVIEITFRHKIHLVVSFISNAVAFESSTKPRC